MSRLRRFTTLARLGIAGLALTGCEHMTKLPEDISTHGHAIDHIFWLIMIIITIAFVGTEVLLLYAVFKFRARPGEKSQHTHGNHLIEMIWTIIPGVILFFLAIYQIPAWTAAKIDEPKDEDCEIIRVFAKQFEWGFQYRGPDKTFDTGDDVYTFQEFVLPAGRPVKMHLRSADVLHSLFMPNLRFKQDLIPGKDIVQWVTVQEGHTTKYARADRSKDDPNWRSFNYEVACAELCGLGHGKMRSRLTILSGPEFDAWLEAQAADGGGMMAPVFEDPGWRSALTTDDPNHMYRQAGSGEKGFKKDYYKERYGEGH